MMTSFLWHAFIKDGIKTELKMLIYQQKEVKWEWEKVGYALVEILENWEGLSIYGRWF
jgi:hypothetical protein